jgi:hypothetical protein
LITCSKMSPRLIEPLPPPMNEKFTISPQLLS